MGWMGRMLKRLAKIPNEPPFLLRNTGSLMGDLALLLTLYPGIPAAKPGLSSTGEFLFLLDRSGSMDCSTANSSDSPSRIQSAKVPFGWVARMS